MHPSYQLIPSKMLSRYLVLWHGKTEMIIWKSFPSVLQPTELFLFYGIVLNAFHDLRRNKSCIQKKKDLENRENIAIHIEYSKSAMIQTIKALNFGVHTRINTNSRLRFHFKNFLFCIERAIHNRVRAHTDDLYRCFFRSSEGSSV